MEGKKGSDMSDVKRIDIKEFQDFGYLQEINRLMLHPLGLALEVVIDDCDHCGASGVDPIPYPDVSQVCPECHGRKQIYSLGGVWDYRDDPEGILFGGDYMPEQAKADRVAEALQEHIPGREAVLGKGRFIQNPVAEE